MHESQSWEIWVVCLIWVQKCVDLAHSIKRVRITMTQVIYDIYRMEELIIPY